MKRINTELLLSWILWIAVAVWISGVIYGLATQPFMDSDVPGEDGYVG